MTWTAPEATRTGGSLVAGEREMLTGYLGWFRGTLLMKCAGLTGEQLAERAVEPSNLSLLPEDGKDAGFERLDPATAAEDYARLVEESRLADEVVAGASFDDTFTHDGEDYNLRMVHIHLISEYARHIGHADLVRERLDGTTGA